MKKTPKLRFNDKYCDTYISQRNEIDPMISAHNFLVLGNNAKWFDVGENQIAQSIQTTRDLGVILDKFIDYDATVIYRSTHFHIRNIGKLSNLCVMLVLHWLKIQDRITYTILMLTYKSYYNIVPTYLCELISRRESFVNTRWGADHHQLIMPPISKDCSNTFLERSFIYAAPCEWNKLSECIRTSTFD